MATALNVASGCCTDNVQATPTRCPRCGYLPKPARTPENCPTARPLKLKLSRAAATRRKLRDLIDESRLPQDEFAQYVLGIDDMTVHRYLKGSVLPQSRMTQLSNIEHISREGDVIHVIIRACPERPRWNWMLKQRKRSKQRKQKMSGLAEITVAQ